VRALDLIFVLHADHDKLFDLDRANDLPRARRICLPARLGACARCGDHARRQNPNGQRRRDLLRDIPLTAKGRELSDCGRRRFSRSWQTLSRSSSNHPAKHVGFFASSNRDDPALFICTSPAPDTLNRPTSRDKHPVQASGRQDEWFLRSSHCAARTGSKHWAHVPPADG